MASHRMCICAAWTRCWHGHSTSQLARNNLDLQRALKTLQPLWWQSSGNPSCCLQFQIHFRVAFFSSAQKVLEGAFTVIVTWPQARATEVCSTAHPHTQSQYIHPLAHSVSPKPSVPRLALTIHSSSQDALRARKRKANLFKRVPCGIRDWEWKEMGLRTVAFKKLLLCFCTISHFKYVCIFLS